MTKHSDQAWTPVVIIGAPRSGTNMLRDILTAHPDAGTWPCDEINYIWRYGNRDYPTDALPATSATPAVSRYIRRQFDWVARKYGVRVVVEKTCANSLRVGFVEKVLPDAKYVFIYRDGRDATLSTMARWTGKAELSYLVRKARFVPPTDVPYYASRFFKARMMRLLNKERASGTWGPKYDGMESLRKSRGLAGVCAGQWAACVDGALDGFAAVCSDRVLHVRYEKFVSNPAVEIRRIAGFVGLPVEYQWSDAVSDVTDRSVGRWSKNREVIDPVLDLIGPVLKRTGHALTLSQSAVST